MRVKLLAAVILLALTASIVLPVGVVLAVSGDREISPFDGYLDGFDPDQFRNEDGKKMSWFERAIANVMWWLMRATITAFRLDPLETLIFQRPLRVYSQFDPTTYSTNPKFFQGHNPPEMGGIFYANEWENIVRPGYLLFRNVALLLIGISIVISGFKIALNAGNPLGRAEAKDIMLNWLITAIGIGMMLTLVLFVIDLNSGLVHAIEGNIHEGLLDRWGSGDSQFVSIRLTESLATGSWFFTFFAYGFLIILTIYFNVLYLLRKFIIMVLIIVGPVVMWAWGKGHQTSFYLWASELLSNVFMQSAHAVVFMLYFTIAASVNQGFMGSPFGKMLLLLMLVPVGVLLRKLITGWFGLIGVDEERSAGVVTGGLFAGGAALFGIGSGIVAAAKSARSYRSSSGGHPGDSGDGSPEGGGIGSFFGPVGAAIGSGLGAVAGGLGGAVAAPVGSSVGAGNWVGFNVETMGRGLGAGAGYLTGQVFSLGAFQGTHGAQQPSAEPASLPSLQPGDSGVELQGSPLNSPLYNPYQALNAENDTDFYNWFLGGRSGENS